MLSAIDCSRKLRAAILPSLYLKWLHNNACMQYRDSDSLLLCAHSLPRSAVERLKWLTGVEKVWPGLSNKNLTHAGQEKDNQQSGEVLPVPSKGLRDPHSLAVPSLGELVPSVTAKLHAAHLQQPHVVITL